jgi:hypothetical protein
MTNRPQVVEEAWANQECEERGMSKTRFQEDQELIAQLRRQLEQVKGERDEEATRHHLLRWSLGLETHPGEDQQSRENSHRNLDALLDAALPATEPAQQGEALVDPAEEREVAYDFISARGLSEAFEEWRTQRSV